MSNTTTVQFTHGRSAVQVATYTNGKTDWVPGSLGYDDSHIWTLEQIEADLAKAYPGQRIVIIDMF